MSHRFPPLAAQMSRPDALARPRAIARVTPIIAVTRELPQISLPWLEIGLTITLLLILSAS